MTAIELAGTWAGTCVNIFLLGFQSRNVNAGRYVMAGLTNAMIGAASLVLMRAAVNLPAITFLAIACTAGPTGICLSIFVSQRLFPKKASS